uniref:Uncharacterized protein n=1 Tax=Dicentrarchus labrax TaxID=13489 RepID=A0A8C4EGG3_DICLA
GATTCTDQLFKHKVHCSLLRLLCCIYSLGPTVSAKKNAGPLTNVVEYPWCRVIIAQLSNGLSSFCYDYQFELTYKAQDRHGQNKLLLHFL